MPKFFSRIWFLNAKILSAFSFFFMRRTQGNFLSVYGEYGEFNNLELFAVQKMFSEYAERIYAYIEKTPRDTKQCISQFKIIQFLNFFIFFLSSLNGMDSRSCPCPNCYISFTCSMMKCSGRAGSREKMSPQSMYLGQQRTKNETLAESLGLPKQVGPFLLGE
jgi:hypothetical protein